MKITLQYIQKPEDIVHFIKPMWHQVHFPASTVKLYLIHVSKMAWNVLHVTEKAIDIALSSEWDTKFEFRKNSIWLFVCDECALTFIF
jgi:hypothetical protein